MQHSAWLDKMYAQRDLHYWKWIKQTMQSADRASTMRLKHRNKCIETDWGWYASLRIVLYTKILTPTNMDIKTRYLGRATYALTFTLQCLEAISEIQLEIVTWNNKYWLDGFK